VVEARKRLGFLYPLVRPVLETGTPPGTPVPVTPHLKTIYGDNLDREAVKADRYNRKIGAPYKMMFHRHVKPTSTSSLAIPGGMYYGGADMAQTDSSPFQTVHHTLSGLIGSAKSWSYRAVLADILRRSGANMEGVDANNPSHESLAKEYIKHMGRNPNTKTHELIHALTSTRQGKRYPNIAPTAAFLDKVRDDSGYVPTENELVPYPVSNPLETGPVAHAIQASSYADTGKRLENKMDFVRWYNQRRREGFRPRFGDNMNDYDRTMQYLKMDKEQDTPRNRGTLKRMLMRVTPGFVNKGNTDAFGKTAEDVHGALRASFKDRPGLLRSVLNELSTEAILQHR
jgi:hypothetical protein